MYVLQFLHWFAVICRKTMLVYIYKSQLLTYITAIYKSQAHVRDLPPFRCNFEKNRTRQMFYHSLKEHPIFRKIAKFVCEVFYNIENIALQSWQLFYILLFYACKTNTQEDQLDINCPHVIQKCTKLTNFTRLHSSLYLFYYIYQTIFICLDITHQELGRFENSVK